MKARVKSTGVELEVHLVDKQARYIGSDGITYWEEDLDFGIEDKNNPDYWTRLEHTYAGMAMQGMMAHTNIDYDEIVDLCVEFAHALVEKMKEERK
mgnify:CR=1 FL=1